jgi:NAD(P)-dependent dehydrogenase (short-subunit alcohol dehydrogenase family)
MNPTNQSLIGVAVHGRDPAALAAVQGEIERDGGRAIGVIVNVTSYAEIETMRLQIERELGPIDILDGIAPETILTERNMNLIPESLRQSVLEQHPIRRLGTPEDVAGGAQ